VLARGVGAVLVTCGGDGCRLFRRGESQAVSIPGHAVPVVDTIGAGDTFTGALAAALARGEELEVAMHQANAAAALAVQGRGAIDGMPDRVAVARLLGLEGSAGNGR
jgi:ribokinase